MCTTYLCSCNNTNISYTHACPCIHGIHAHRSNCVCTHVLYIRQSVQFSWQLLYLSRQPLWQLLWQSLWQPLWQPWLMPNATLIQDRPRKETDAASVCPNHTYVTLTCVRLCVSVYLFCSYSVLIPYSFRTHSVLIPYLFCDHSKFRGSWTAGPTPCLTSAPQADQKTGRGRDHGRPPGLGRGGHKWNERGGGGRVARNLEGSRM